MAMRTVPDSVLQRATRGPASLAARKAPILRRAELLPDPDRTLIRSSLSGELSFRDLESLLGKSAGYLCRRAHRLIDRLSDPIVVALVDVAGAPAGPGADLTEQQRRIGLDHFLLNIPASVIARRLDVPYRNVQQVIGYVRGWSAGVNRRVASH